MATRMALDLDLPQSYNNLSANIMLGQSRVGPESPDWDILLQETRTWLSILVLRLMLGIDTGESLDFNLYGNVRRYRILLGQPFSTELDVCLLEQVELNVLRAKIYKSLTKGAKTNDEGLMNVIREVRIDIEVWYKDWTQVLNSHPQANWLAINLEVQRYWADITTLCWALNALNEGSLDIISPTQRDILLMMENSLRQHLHAVIAEPRLYIHNMRYATDYVWAKLIFCFLLLLELSTLISGEKDSPESQRDLLSHGYTLLGELENAGGVSAGETCSQSSRDYLQILRMGIDNYSQSIADTLNKHPPAGNGDENSLDAIFDFDSLSGMNRVSLVPEHFISEWKFPGLRLHSRHGSIY